MEPNPNTKVIKTTKLVRESVTQIRWTIQDFSQAMFPANAVPLRSDPVELDDGSEMSFGFVLHCPTDMNDHTFMLEFQRGACGGKNPLEIDCKFWLENSEGDTYAETEELHHVFLCHTEGNEVSIEDFLDRVDFLNDFSLYDGTATICAEIRYKMSEEDYVEPEVKSELREKLWASYQKGLTDDFVIQVGGKQLKVAQNVLAANSDVFKQMLITKCCKEVEEGVVEIQGTTYEAMKAFVEYLHRGKCENMKEVCDDLFALARRYMVPKLQADCIDEMAKNLNKENVLERLKLAFLLDEERLKDATIAYITFRFSDFNFRTISTSAEWKEYAISNHDIAKQITNAVYDKMCVFIKKEEDDEVPMKRVKLE